MIMSSKRNEAARRTRRSERRTPVLRGASTQSTDRPSPLKLHTAEAIELGHAWLQDIARSRDVRVLFIKGPVLHWYGLRPGRQSADIDILVEPERFDVMMSALQTAGWAERPGDPPLPGVTTHSRTLIHAEWPCDIDLHFRFPGFLAPPSHAFDALWETRRKALLGHKPCDVPSRSGAALEWRPA